jgi:hypothetical protein
VYGFFGRLVDLPAGRVLDFDGVCRLLGGPLDLLADGVLEAGGLLDGARELGGHPVYGFFGRLVDLPADRILDFDGVCRLLGGPLDLLADGVLEAGGLLDGARR